MTHKLLFLYQIIEECPVNKIITRKRDSGRKEVLGVETPFGVIKTNCVLNAAGVWSKSVAKLAGIDIPLIPMKHAYIITETMENVKGCPNLRDHDASIYFKIQGSSIQIGGYESNPLILQSVRYYITFFYYQVEDK